MCSYIEKADAENSQCHMCEFVYQMKQRRSFTQRHAEITY